MIDLLLSDTFDVEIADDDFVAHESTRQHQILLLQTTPGEWRESPLTGVGVSNFLNDENDSATLMNEIKKQFLSDGMIINYLKGDIGYVDNWTIKADGYYAP